MCCDKCLQLLHHSKQDAQVSQRDRAAGCAIVFAQSRRDNILQTLWVYLQPLWYNRPENRSNSVKKSKIKAITAFRVIEVGTNRKPLCNFLLVFNSNWHPVSYVQCSSWPHWKARSGLAINVNWTFSLCVTAESLRAKIDRKSTISLQRSYFDPKFQVKGVAPTNHLCTVS